MRKLNLLGAISLFLILSGLSCKKDEGPEPATVCGLSGELKRNQRAQVSWNESLNDWVLRVDNEDNGDFDGFPLLDCSGLPSELQQSGIEIVGDIAYSTNDTANPFLMIAILAESIELKKYKITNIPD